MADKLTKAGFDVLQILLISWLKKMSATGQKMPGISGKSGRKIDIY